MSICYAKLFKLLEEKGISTYYLRQNKIMGQQTYYNLKNGKGNLGTETLEKLCGLLNCQPGDLMEYIPDNQQEFRFTQPKEAELHSTEFNIAKTEEPNDQHHTIQFVKKEKPEPEPITIKLIRQEKPEHESIERILVRTENKN